MLKVDQITLNFKSASPAATQQLGAGLGGLVRPGDVLTLSGELGAGKTTFIIGLARGWGTADTVTSPTFVIVNEYRRADGLRLRHLDCYRLNSGADALALGFLDLLDDPAPMVIEWPERIADVLPPERLALTLTWVSDTERNLQFVAHGARYEQLLAGFRQTVALG